MAALSRAAALDYVRAPTHASSEERISLPDAATFEFT